MARRTKAPSQPSIDDERLLEEIVDNDCEYITIRDRRFGFHDLNGHGRHKISRILLKENTDEFAISCKCLAAAKLNGYFAIKFLWRFLWRWYYYVRQYSDSELIEAMALIKKKVAPEDYWRITMLQIGMRETVMQMNRREVSAFLQERSTGKAGKSAKSDHGSQNHSES